MFITDAIRSGLPPHIAQVIAGHANIITTMGYHAGCPTEIIEAHRAYGVAWIHEHACVRCCRARTMPWSKYPAGRMKGKRGEPPEVLSKIWRATVAER